MRVLNQHDEVKWTQNFTETCEMEINIRQSQSQHLSQLLSSIYGVSVTKTEKQAIE